jgi:flagellar basal body rod protein FlgG
MTIGMIQSAQGVQNAEAQFNQVAEAIAAPQADSVGLSAQAVALIQAKSNFELNLKALQAADDMTKTLLKAVG